MKLVGLFTVLCVALSAARSSHAHPFHASLAEVEFNAQTHSLEVALRVDAGDLEEALRRMTKKSVDLDKTPQVDRLIQQLLVKSFQVKDASQVTTRWARHKWIGWQLQTRNAWVYFEVPLPTTVESITVQFPLFLEQVPRQVNMFSLKENGKRRSMMFHRLNPKRVIRLTSSRVPKSKP